jgi:hypothetical protein
VNSNVRRLSLCALLVFVAKAAVGALVFGLLAAGLDEPGSPAFRPEGTERHGVALAGYVAWAVAFSLLLASRPVNRVRDGLRFGLLVWLLYFVPMSLGLHAYFVVDGRWTALALLSGLAEALACGSVAGWVLAGSPRAAPPRSLAVES